MATTNIRVPAPVSTPISDTDQKSRKLTGYVPLPWSDYFNGLDAQLAQSYVVLEHVQVPSIAASIGVTPITNQILSAGLYRISQYTVTLQADNVASAFTFILGFTDRGTSRTIQNATMSANSVAASQTFTYFVRADRATPITYSVLYGSTGGAPKAIFSLDLLLEQVLSLP